MKRIIFCALFLASCGGHVARVAEPAAIYDTVTASDYAEAEEHFAGGAVGGPKVLPAMANPFTNIYWDDARCQALLDKRDISSAMVLGFGGLTGAGGIAMLIPKDATDEERNRWNLGLGISTLAVATTATILGALVRSWSNVYEENCHTERSDEPYEHPASDEVEPESPVEVELVPDVYDGGVE